MGHQEKIRELTELLLFNLKSYFHIKKALDYEIERRTYMAQIAVNVMFDLKIAPGVFCEEVYNCRDRSVKTWTSEYALQESY